MLNLKAVFKTENLNFFINWQPDENYQYTVKSKTIIFIKNSEIHDKKKYLEKL